jgi:hypothetical protein
MVGVLAPQESDLISEISISKTKMLLRYVVNRVISFESVIRRLRNHRRTHKQLCHTNFPELATSPAIPHGTTPLDSLVLRVYPFYKNLFRFSPLLPTLGTLIGMQLSDSSP